MSYRLLILLIAFIHSYSLGAQSTEYDFPAMRWTTAYGLKSNSVNDLVVDSRGVIWVATDEGIYRHQGNTFENINSIIENSPFDNPIEGYDLYIDKSDRMWIGTVENGLLMYDIKKNVITQFDVLINANERLTNLRIYGLHMLNDSIFRFTSHTHGLIDYNIYQDNFEIIEVFTDSLELVRLDGFQKMIRPLESAESQIVDNWYYSLVGMVEYDSKLDTFFYHDDEGDHMGIRKAIMDKDSVSWCVTYGKGLYSFDMRSKKFKNYRCHEGIAWSHSCLTGATLELYNDSTLILDSSDGLYYFNKNSHKYYRFHNTMPHSLWSGITQEMEWINGELWQASLSSTLYRHFKDDHGVHSVSSSRTIDNVQYDHIHNTYVSVSYPDLITIHYPNHYEELYIPRSVNSDDVIEDVAIDNRGNYWIAAHEQVLMYNMKSKKFSIPFKEILTPLYLNLTFRKIDRHPNGNIWVTSHDGTIFTFDPVTLDYEFYGSSLVESHPLEYQYRAMLEGFSEDGYTWFSSQEGFFAISAKDQRHKFCKNLKIRSTDQPITLLSPSIGIGKDGMICFGTKTHEVYMVHSDSLDGGLADLIDLKDLVPNLSINDIEIDDQNSIWIATKMGLIRIDSEYNVQLYGDAHRLGNLSELEIKDGKYPYVTSKNYFRIIDPEKLKPFPGITNIQLLNTELDAKEVRNSDGTSLRTGQIIELGPKDNFLRIKFNDFNYVSQQPKIYAIKIDGFHDDWIDLKERNEFGFSGLSGGEHNVWVKSKLQFAKEYSEPVNLLTVHVTPPLMKRKSFWAFCGVLLLLLFYLGYRYRLLQLKEKQNLMIAFNKQLAETEMKALRAQMNPHFLFNVLNAIKLNVQKNEQENAIDFITDFSKLIRSVLQNSGKQRITLEEELQTLELYIKIERKRFSTSFDYEFSIDESINASKITIPPMLLQPYVENAIWHGILHKSEGNGQINVNTNKSGESIIVEIIDNGIGREKANKLKLKSAQKNKSMGMQITKDRMAISNMVSNDHIAVEIVDLYDEHGHSAGTKVVIVLRQK